MSECEEKVLSHHVWNENRLAISKRNCSELFIYEIPEELNPSVTLYDEMDYSSWPCLFIIEVVGDDCDSEISFDWNPNTDQIVTSTQGKICKLWNLDELIHLDDSQSEPVHIVKEYATILTRSKTPSTFCKWSRNGSKFAMGAHKLVASCFYEKESGFGFSKQKRLNSSVTAMAWHPDNQTLACIDSSNQLLIYCARNYTDKPKKRGRGGGTVIFRDQLENYTHHMEFSPNGSWLAILCNNSSITFYRYSDDRLDPSFHDFTQQTVLCSGLAFTCGIFLSNKLFVTAGYENAPFLFELKDGVDWKLIGKLENENGMNHSKQIHSIQLFRENEREIIFTTGSYDNRIHFWRIFKN